MTWPGVLARLSASSTRVIFDVDVDVDVDVKCRHVGMWSCDIFLAPLLDMGTMQSLPFPPL
jgi:hypothetical protein